MFTLYGFYSVVCARKGDGRKSNPPDPHRMMVRARDKVHIEFLQKRFPSLKQYEIKESQTNDYRFRIIVPKWRWQRVMQGLVREQDYDNFKSEVDRVWGTGTTEQTRYHDKLLLKVWSAAYGFQSGKYGPGIYEKPKGGKKKAKKGKKGAKQTTLLPQATAAAHESFLEPSPFAPKGPEPGPNSDVLVVLDQDTAAEVVVVWEPGGYSEDARAYADAIGAGVCEVVAHPEYQHMRWSEAKVSGAPVFDAEEKLGG